MSSNNGIVVQVSFDAFIHNREDYDYDFVEKIREILENAGLEIYGIDTTASWSPEVYFNGGK